MCYLPDASPVTAPLFDYSMTFSEERRESMGNNKNFYFFKCFKGSLSKSPNHLFFYVKAKLP
ncbi:hypothetical protein IX51_05465 [uncultured archaeon]|nr:hypothetical protein IX51_05465 [uncultured archaeon]